MAAQRSSPQDLEISGDVPGIPPGGKRFVGYADLSRLAQETFTVKNDENFSDPVTLSGVSLDAIMAALGIDGATHLIAASAVDGYEAHYTAEYRAAHHPFLVLRIGGQEPAKWPKGPNGENYGPWLISHPSFSPAFHVLAHKDEAQIPYGVIGLRFLDEAAVLKELRPPGAVSRRFTSNAGLPNRPAELSALPSRGRHWRDEVALWLAADGAYRAGQSICVW